MAQKKNNELPELKMYDLSQSDQLVADFHKTFKDQDINKDVLIDAYRKYGKGKSLVRGLYQDLAPEKYDEEKVNKVFDEYNLDKSQTSIVENEMKNTLFSDDFAKPLNELPEPKRQKIKDSINTYTQEGVVNNLEKSGITPGKDNWHYKTVLRELERRYKQKGGTNPYGALYRYKAGRQKLMEEYRPIIQNANNERKEKLKQDLQQDIKSLGNELGIKRTKDGKIQLPGQKQFQKYLNEGIQELSSTFTNKGWGIPDIYTPEKRSKVQERINQEIDKVRGVIDKRINNIEQQLQQNQGAFPDVGTAPSPTATGYKEQGEGVQALRTTLDNLKAAKSYLESPGKESFSALLYGLRSTSFLKDVMSVGIANIERNMQKLDISNKISEGKELNEQEKSLASSYTLLNEIKANKKIPMSFEVGRQMANMVPYIEQIAATRGLGMAVEDAAIRGIGTGILGKGVGFVSRAGTQAAAMPMFYSDWALERAGYIKEDKEKNEFESVGRTEPGKALLKAYGETVAEVAGENLGEVMLDWAPIKRISNKLAEKVPEAARTFNRKINAIGYQGVPMEMLEEEFTGLTQSIMNNDWSFFTDGRKQLSTLATIAGMSGAFGAVSLSFKGAGKVQQKIYENRIESNFRKAENDMVSALDNNEQVEAVKSLVDNVSDMNSQEIGNGIRSLDENYNLNSKQKELVKNYLYRRAMRDGLQAYKEAKRAQKKKGSQKTGRFTTHKTTSEKLPAYRVGDTTYDTKESFLNAVRQYKGQQNTPQITVNNDSDTAQQAENILQQGLEEETTNVSETVSQEEQAQPEQQPQAEEQASQRQPEEVTEAGEEISFEQSRELSEEEKQNYNLESGSASQVYEGGTQVGEVVTQETDAQYKIQDINAPNASNNTKQKVIDRLANEAQQKGKDLVVGENVQTEASDVINSLEQQGRLSRKDEGVYEVQEVQTQETEQAKRQAPENLEENVSQEIQDYASEQGFENIHQAFNSVRKNVRSDVTSADISRQDIEQAAQKSETVQKKKTGQKKKISFQEVPDQNLTQDILQTIEQYPENKNPGQIGKAINQVKDRLSNEDQKKIFARLKEKQQRYKEQQAQLERQGLEETLEAPEGQVRQAAQRQAQEETAEEAEDITPSLQDASNKIKQGQVEKPEDIAMGAMKSGENFDIVWDDLLGSISAALDEGRSLSDAVADGLKDMRERQWYKNLSKQKKRDFEKKINQHFTEQLFEPKIAKKDVERLQKQSQKESGKELSDVRNRAAAYGQAIVNRAQSDMAKKEARSILSAIKNANTYRTLNNQIGKLRNVIDQIEVREEQRQVNKIRKQLNKKALREQDNPYSGLQERVVEMTNIKPQTILKYGGRKLFNEYKTYLDALSQKSPTLPEGKTVKDFSEFMKRLTETIDSKINKPLVNDATKQQAFEDIIPEIQNNLRENNKSAEDWEEVQRQLQDELNISTAQAQEIVNEYKKGVKIKEKRLQNISAIANKIDNFKNEGLSESEIVEKLASKDEGYDVKKEEAKQLLDRYKAYNDEVMQTAKEARDNLNTDREFFTEDQLEVVDALSNLSDADLNLLSTKELQLLNNVYSALNQGWLSGIAWKRFINKINTVRTAEKIKEQFKVKGLTEQQRTKRAKTLLNRLENTELYKIDQALGVLGEAQLHDEIIKPLSRAMEKAKRYTDILDQVEDIHKRIKDERSNETHLFDSTVLLEMYLQQRMANSNGLSGDAIRKLLDATEDSSKFKSLNMQKEKDRMEELYKSLPKDEEGNIDMNRFYNETLTKSEREFVAFHDQTIQDDLSQKISFVQQYIRAGSYEAIPHYAKRMALNENDNIEDVVITKKTGTNLSGKPSVRAGSSYKRVAKYPAINFDAIGNFHAGVRDAYYDYYVTPAIQKTFDTLKQVEDTFEKGSKDAIFTHEVSNLLSRIVNNQFAGERTKLTDTEKIIRALEKQGYMSTLGSIRRPASEFLSNLMLVSTYDMGAVINGMNVSHKDYRDVMRWVGSSHLDRIGKDTIDINETNQRNAELNRKAKLSRSTAAKIADFSQYNPLSKLKFKFGSAMIASADRAMSEVFWKGMFNKEFKKITGEEFDIEKFWNDSGYAKKHKESIEKASGHADYHTSIIVNTTSEFESLARISQMETHERRNFMHQVNTFVWRFAKNEQTSALLAIRSMTGKNQMSPTQGAGLLVGLVGRQMVYNTAMMATYLAAQGAGTGDWENWNTYWKKFSRPEGLLRNILGGALMLSTGKFANIVRTPILFGIEQANKMITNELRANKYNSFHDSLVYNIIGDDIGKTENVARALGVWGHYLSPLIESGTEISDPKSTESEDAINWFQMISVVLDGLVGVPDYKDLNSIMNSVKRNQDPYFSAIKKVNDAVDDEDKDIEWLDKELRKIKDLSYEGTNKPRFMKNYEGGRRIRQLAEQNMISKKAANRLNIGTVTGTYLNNKEKAEYLVDLRDEVGKENMEIIIDNLMEGMYMPGRGNATYQIISNDLRREYEKAKANKK